MSIPRSLLAALLLAVTATTGQARPQQLPPVPVPPENPITPQKAVLGKILFWDEQLSSDNTMACGTCHIPAAGGAEARLGPPTVHPGNDGLRGTPDDTRGSPGVVRADALDEFLPDVTFRLAPQVTPRHTPSAIGAQFFDELFWDGRASSTFVDPVTRRVLIPSGGALESQAAGPPVSDVEMAHEARDWSQITAKLAVVEPLALAGDPPPDVLAALAVSPDYPSLFAQAFGDETITAGRIAFAMATYERTLVPDQTPWDAFIQGTPGALTADQQLGFQVFQNQGQCAFCHPPPLFSDGSFRSLGLRPSFEDRGRQEVTGAFADRGTFKVPGLRNVGLRQGFFHTGGIPALPLLVNFYDAGGGPFDNKDLIVEPLGLTPPQRAALVDFLGNGLTDPRVANELPPFDRPTLRSESAEPGPPLSGTGRAGSGGFVPAMIARTPPKAGTPGFKLGVSRALGGAAAYLVLEAPGSGTPAMLRPASARAAVSLNGQGPGAGYGTVHLPLENWSAAVGLTLRARWFVLDPGAQGGVAHSRTAEIVPF